MKPTVLSEEEIFCEKTLVLVTNQFECERIIRSGKVIADITKTDLVVLSIQNPKYDPNPEAVEYLFKTASSSGAVMHVLYADNIPKAIISFIKHNKIMNVLTGMPQGNSSVLHKVWNKFTHVHFFTVNKDGNVLEVVNKQEHGFIA